MNLIQTY